MPKKLAIDLDARVTAAIRRQPKGSGAAEIVHRFAREASPRSIKRLLRQLVRQQHIDVRGAGRATRYFPAPRAASVPDPRPTTAAADPALPAIRLSAAAAKLRTSMQRPPPQRRPVGYDLALLDEYRPNETFYLGDGARRARLREIGHASIGQGATSAIRDSLQIDLAWASSRLEGSTYTRRETLHLLRSHREPEGKRRAETQMILNHQRAIAFLIDGVDEVGFNRFTLTNLHALLAEGLLAGAAVGGRLRERVADISGTVYRPLAVPQQIEELFRRILLKAHAIGDPFEQAFFVLVHVPYLQPFEEANKRVSRLAANIPFIRGNLCPLSFVDLPERAYLEGLLAVYECARVELLRDLFLWAYERSCEHFRAVALALPEPDPFRLRYRAELTDAVSAIVRSAAGSAAAMARESANDRVAPEDRPRFIKLVLDELRNLHEGNVARHRLRLGEFRQWQAGRR